MHALFDDRIRLGVVRQLLSVGRRRNDEHLVDKILRPVDRLQRYAASLYVRGIGSHHHARIGRIDTRVLQRNADDLCRGSMRNGRERGGRQRNGQQSGDKRLDYHGVPWG